MPTAVLAFVGAAAQLAAQCAPAWLPGGGLPGTDGDVYATAMWDRDGAGPVPPVVAVAGYFTLAGTVQAANVATYDPASGAWAPLGAGLNGRARAVATMANGDLVVGGAFTSANGVGASSIARWNGANWSPLGSGMNAEVLALRTLPNGDLVASGEFTTAGGVAALGIAKWDGTTWSPIGGGLAGGFFAGVTSLGVLPNGDVVAGGEFTVAAGAPADHLARWNGSSWSPLGAGVNGAVRALATVGNTVVVGGEFTTAGGGPIPYLARWDGASWSALGGGTNSWVYALQPLANGDLLAGGVFSSAGGASAQGIARWNGAAWSSIGAGLAGQVATITEVPNGDLVAGGILTLGGGAWDTGITRWDGSTWAPLGAGPNQRVTALLPLPNGELVVGGMFTMIGGVGASRVARWNGAAWSPLGAGIAGGSTQPYVSALAALPNGDLVVAGDFTIAGGASANYIARWDGTGWTQFGGGMDGPVNCLLVMPNGDLVAGGHFATAGGVPVSRIARWNGTTWIPLGAGVGGGSTWYVLALALLPDGDIVAGGHFTTAGTTPANHVARWNGTAWSALGAGVGGPIFAPFVLSLAAMPNGDVVAGGRFLAAGGVNAYGIARWNGASWSPLGAGVFTPTALAALPNGDVVASYYPSLGSVARWNGTNWSGFGGGVDGEVIALANAPNGDLVVGGDFRVVDGAGAPALARLTATCPATATPFGAGCVGPGGLEALVARSLPWTGSTFRSVATGLPATALSLGVLGFATVSVPMPAILPQGIAGCTLHVSPDALVLLLPSAGSVELELLIPNTVALASANLHEQVASLALDPFGNIVALTGTNALALTIGAF